MTLSGLCGYAVRSRRREQPRRHDGIMRISQDILYPRQISESWDILRISPSWDNPGLSSSASLTAWYCLTVRRYEYSRTSTVDPSPPPAYSTVLAPSARDCTYRTRLLCPGYSYGTINNDRQWLLAISKDYSTVQYRTRQEVLPPSWYYEYSIRRHKISRTFGIRSRFVRDACVVLWSSTVRSGFRPFGVPSSHHSYSIALLWSLLSSHVRSFHT